MDKSERKVRMQERRKSNRMKIDVSIKLNSVKNSATDTSVLNKESFTVDLVNLSKDGIGFTSTEKLELNTFYDTIIEIVRMENYGDGPTLYGCRFVGIMPSDQLKIQIYEMINENNK